MVSNFHVALVSVENNGFLRVVLFHHFHCQTTNGRLEIGLFGVNHASEISDVEKCKKLCKEHGNLAL